MSATPISIARRRAALAKRTLAFGSALAFVVTIGLARSSHPAAAASISPPSASTPAQNQGSGDANTSNYGTFGQPDVGAASPSQAPSVSTGAS